MEVEETEVKTNFYPRPPCGGRLREWSGGCKIIDFYPRPPCGGRRSGNCHAFYLLIISIHALRVEGDMCWIS